MGYVLPDWVDRVLDFIGISWPNVDEDDYREMADAMRDFAEKFEGHGADAHAAVSRVLASSEGWAVDALQEHWNQVRASHLNEVPEVARLFATACDAVADIIFGMKTKAEAELAAEAASLGISAVLTVVSGGLSALIGAAETAAMRELIRRIIREAADEIVNRLLAEVTEPVTAKLEKMAEDAVLDIADDAIHLPPGAGDGGAGDHTGGGSAGGGSHGGVTLDAFHGGGHWGGGGHGRVRLDHAEVNDGADKLSIHGIELNTASSSSLGRARGAFGRTCGKDAFTQPFDGVLHGALQGTEKALKKLSKHLTDAVPNGMRAMSRRHKDNDAELAAKMRSLGGEHDGPNAPSGGGGDRSRSGDRRVDTTPGRRDRPADPELSEKGRERADITDCNDPINVATGEVLLEETDLLLPGVLPLEIARAHRSTYRDGHFFGPSWASLLDERLEAAGEDDELWWHTADASSKRYPYAPDLVGESVLPREGRRVPLTRVAGTHSWDLAVFDPRTGLTRRFLPEDTEAGDRGEPLVWWLADVTDRNGNTYSILRGDDGVPQKIVHSGGYQILLETDPESRRISRLSLADPAAGGGACEVRRYTYDADGNLAEVINSSGLPLRLFYDDDHRLTQWTDRNGYGFQYVYDPFGRVVQTIGPDGMLSSTLSYDADERRTIYTDSTGAVTVYHLNHLGQVIAETDPLGHTTHTVWDRWDHVLSRTDALGNTTVCERDEHGDITAVTYADGSRVEITYDPHLHLPTRIQQPDGTAWEQEFDTRGNLVAQTAPDGTTAHFTHRADGALLRAVDPNGAITVLECDEAALPMAVVDGLGHRTTCRRNAFGQVIEASDATGRAVRMEWTPDGHPLRRTGPDGAEESWVWDGEGNCLTHRDPRGKETFLTYGAFDLAATRTTPDGALYRFAYDTELRLTTVTDPDGLTWRYEYDRVGRLIQETDFDGRAIAYRYDATGCLVQRAAPNGSEIRLTHDALGRLLTKDVDGAVTTFTYDRAGRLTGAAAPGSSLGVHYDAQGRLLEETVDGRTIRFTYDLAGYRTTRTLPSGVVSTMAYDPAGNRTVLQTGLRPGNRGHSIAFAHDAAGRELQRLLDDSTAFTFAWDNAGRLESQQVATPGSRSLERSYTYRIDGYPTGWRDRAQGTAHEVSLDNLGRPLAVTGTNWREQYAYDAKGNQTEADWSGRRRDSTSGPRSYNGNRISRAGRTSYVHDDAGRLVERRIKHLSGKQEVWRFSWDGEDQLTSCTTPDGALWRYTYDALGRRTAKHRISEDGSVEQSVFYTWDAYRLAEQHDTATATTTTWDYDGHEPLTQHEMRHLSDGEADTRFYALVTDLVGTPTELVDESGSIAGRATTNIWGDTTWSPNGSSTPLRFPGQYEDPESGLHYNCFRYYDPAVGRYISPDPLGLGAGPNPLGYVVNPSVWVDVLGLAVNDCRKDVTWGGRVKWKEPDIGRAQGMTARIHGDMIGGGSRPKESIRPPGYGGKPMGHARGHLLAKQLGGSGDIEENLMTLYQNPTNSPEMRAFEIYVRGQVEQHGTAFYRVTPEYHEQEPLPRRVILEAWSKGGYESQIVENRNLP